MNASRRAVPISRGAPARAAGRPGPASPPPIARKIAPTSRVALAAAAGLFLLHAALLWHFVIDDAFISYRVARHVAAGLGPVFNPGERVEAFSNPLFTFLLAPFAAMSSGAEWLPAVARAVGVAAGGLSLVVLAALALPGGAAATTLALLLCAASTSFTLWSVGGLETSLYGLLVIAAFALTLTRPRGRGEQLALGGLLAAVTLSRPEGALVAAALLGWRWIDRETRADAGGNARVALGAVLPPVACVLFRNAFFGEWLPNTYFAKHVALEQAMPRGFVYLAEFIRDNGTWMLYAPALAGLARLRREPVIALAALVLAAYLPYVVAVGGDWMDAHRFLAPVMPLIALLLASGWVELFGMLRGAFASRPALVGVARPLGVAIVALAFALANLPGTRQVRAAPYVNARPYYATMGRLVATIAQPGWSVATDDIGAIGWYGRIRVLDLLGLASADLARHRTTAQILLAERRPELVIAHYDDAVPPASRWRAPAMPGFDDEYARPRGPVPIPGSLRVRRDALPWAEARLARLPAALDSELVRLDAFLRERQPDMKPVPAGIGP